MLEKVFVFTKKMFTSIDLVNKRNLKGFNSDLRSQINLENQVKAKLYYVFAIHVRFGHKAVKVIDVHRTK